MCTMAGTGILQLPFTLKQGGWVCLALIICVGVMTNYTAKALIYSLYVSRDDGTTQRLESYAALGYEAYGTAGRVVVNVFQKSTLVGVSTIFLILAGKFLLEGIGGGGEGLYGDLGTASTAEQWQHRWTIISGCVVMIPVVGIKTLNEIAPLAAFGLLASFLLVVQVVVFSVVLHPITPKTVADHDLPTPSNFSWGAGGEQGDSVGHATVNAADFPPAFAAIVLSFGGHAVFPSIEAVMRKPAQFPRAIDASFAALLVLYIATASTGYWAFGGLTYSPILCNFPRDVHTPMGALAAVMKLVIAFHVLSAYPILMNVLCIDVEQGLGLGGGVATKEEDVEMPGPLDAALRAGGGGEGALNGGGGGGARAQLPPSNLASPSSSSSCWARHRVAVLRSLLRATLVILTTTVAVAVPFFAPVMSFVGATCLTMVVFVLPVVFSWKLRGRRMGLLEKVFGILVICCGVMGGTIGSIQAVAEIVAKFQNGDFQ